MMRPSGNGRLWPPSTKYLSCCKNTICEKKYAVNLSIPTRIVKRLAYSLTSLEPIPSKYDVIPSRRGERYRNLRTAVDFDASVSPSSLMESKWWEVEISANLIFCLEGISEVSTRHDRTVCSRHSILPGIPSLLQPVPVKDGRNQSGYTQELLNYSKQSPFD